MQISRASFSPIHTVQHQGPSMVQQRLEALVDQLDALGTKLARETKAGFYVSREWPVDARAATTQLQFAGDAMTRLGGTHEAILGAALHESSSAVGAFANELRTAYETRSRFSSKHTYGIELLASAAKLATAALLSIEQAPARP